jgi:bacterioferritin (cytochrome b1)
MTAETVHAVQQVLAALIDSVNQLFFHSRMLRTWGHSLGMERHREWLGKMRWAHRLVESLTAMEQLPIARDAVPLRIGADAESILRNDLALGEEFVELIDRYIRNCDEEMARSLFQSLKEAEAEDLANLESWLDGPQVSEAPRNAKFLLPKPGGELVAVDAINSLLPMLTAAVSGVFFHSLIFAGRNQPELYDRELQVALRLMYRSEALLERLLELGGVPVADGHGRIAIASDEPAIDQVLLTTHVEIEQQLSEVLPAIDGLTDPTTHTLLHGIRLATREDLEDITKRIANH